MALVSQKTLFIHIPKTGGSTVRTMMDRAGLVLQETGPFRVEQHYGLPEIRAAHPDLVDGRTSFAFVRHPISWIKSRWAWAVVNRFPERMKLDPTIRPRWLADCWSDDFSRFVIRYLDSCPGIYSHHIFPKLGYWNSGAPPVDMVGKTETLVENLIAILRKAGEDFDEAALRAVPREKVAASGVLAQRTLLSESLMDAICDAEQQVIKKFGYGSRPG